MSDQDTWLHGPEGEGDPEGARTSPTEPAPAPASGFGSPGSPSLGGRPPTGGVPYAGGPSSGSGDRPLFGSSTWGPPTEHPWEAGPYYGPPAGEQRLGPMGQPLGPSTSQFYPYPPSRQPRRNAALRSAAAVMLVVAAAVGGAGVSRVIWPSGQASSIAAQGGSSTPTSPVPSYGNSGSGNTSEGSGGPSDVGVIAAKVDPALVDVNSIFNYDEAEGAGTGIVLTSTGEILTNNHVVDGATKISVTDVGNGKTYLATVVGYDNTHDVAVLQLQGASGLQTAKLGDSTRLSVGEAVVAIGNAGGAGGTPTSAGGSVTGLGQSITASDGLTGTSEQLSGLIEVNANVESGDSGGPLVNASGQVVGMDTAAEQGFSFQASGNQGFAIPIDQALAIARQIVAGSGSSTVHVGPTGFLGLLVHTPSNSSGLFGNTGSSGGQQYPNVAGAEISGVVSGGPAAKAGVVAGDVITSFDGQTLSSGSDLTHLLVPHHPGDKVELGWVDSSGQSHTAMVQLASGPPA